jgi:hypothetical protein
MYIENHLIRETPERLARQLQLRSHFFLCLLAQHTLQDLTTRVLGYLITSASINLRLSN